MAKVMKVASSAPDALQEEDGDDGAASAGRGKGLVRAGPPGHAHGGEGGTMEEVMGILSPNRMERSASSGSVSSQTPSDLSDALQEAPDSRGAAGGGVGSDGLPRSRGDGGGAAGADAADTGAGRASRRAHTLRLLDGLVDGEGSTESDLHAGAGSSG